MKVRKAGIAGVIVLALIAGGLLVKTYYDAGEFKEIKTRLNGQCRTITGVLSSEDIAVDRTSGMAYSKDPEKISPSQVIRVTVREHREYSVEEIYLDTGESLSGSSVAAAFGDTLLIGSVFDKRFLRCQFP